MNPVTQHLISSYLLMPLLTVIFGVAAYFIARKNRLLNNKKLIVYLLLCGIVLALPGLSAENIDASILLSTMLPALLTIIVLMIIYIFVPNKKVRFTNAACGALIAMLLFAILRKCFGMTVQASAAYQTLYGALAIIPIFLAWMYSAWAVGIFGAVVTAALDDFQGMDRRSLKKSIVLNDPEKRDFVKNHPSRKKLLQKEQN